MLAAIQKHTQAWKEITIADLEIVKLAGLSNACYRVSAKNTEPKSFLFRVF